MPRPQISKRSAAKEGFRWIGLATLLGALIAAVPLGRADALTRWSAVAGWLVSLVLCGSGWLGVTWAVRRSQKAMMMATFGGMLGRLVVAGAATAVSIGFGWVHHAAFVMGLLGSFTVYQAVEITLVHRLNRSLFS